jgi:tetratricopeptide (TPR) repeat protein
MGAIESHRQIASQCFNRVWDFLDLQERTKEEEEQMVHLAHTSFWHWTQVEEHTPQNLSIGYWQIARVYAVVGNGEQSQYYADRCIEVSLEASIPPFYIGYGYEALARAYMVLGQNEIALDTFQKALRYAEEVVVEDSKKMLLKDLYEIKEVITA